MAAITTPPSAGVVIVGAGLAGALLALALRERGQAVALIDAPLGGSDAATAISYGALPGWPLAATPLARLAATAARRWRQLQHRHGDLGWRPRRLRLQGPGPAVGALGGLWPLPFSQVDTTVLSRRWPALLAAAGVEQQQARVEELQAPAAGGPWRLQLRRADGACSWLAADQVVLAAGAACHRLWPQLPPQLRNSWAAVLELQAYPPALGRPRAWLPSRFARVALEQRVEQLLQPQMVLDAGLVPRGDGALLGQLSWVGPGLDPEAAPADAEARLREQLGRDPWAAPLAPLPGRLRLAPVAFCPGGKPLVGPVPGAPPGLALFSGFSAGFSQVPVLAPLLADLLAAHGNPEREGAVRQSLQRLGVWPQPGG